MILDERGKKHVLKQGEEFQSDLGIIKADVLDNAEVGDEIKSHNGHSFKIIKPNINDFIDVMDRRCSILLKKDIGYVLAHTGLGAGSRVVDAGTGAGAIALNFGNVVGSDGHVYTTLTTLELKTSLSKTRTSRKESMRIILIWSFWTFQNHLRYLKRFWTV